MSAAPASVGIIGVGQVAITVHDLKRAVDFYTRVLGLPFLFEIPNAAFVDCGGLRLMLALPDDPALDRPSAPLYYKVPDIHAAHSALQAGPVPPLGPPHLVGRMPDHELWMFSLNDPEGNLLVFMSEVRG